MLEAWNFSFLLYPKRGLLDWCFDTGVESGKDLYRNAGGVCYKWNEILCSFNAVLCFDEH